MNNNFIMSNQCESVSNKNKRGKRVRKVSTTKLDDSYGESGAR